MLWRKRNTKFVEQKAEFSCETKQKLSTSFSCVNIRRTKEIKEF